MKGKVKLFPFEKILALVLILFLLIFPKGGFKLSGAPVTFGYLFLVASSFLFYIKGAKYFSKKTSILLGFLLPFQSLIFISLIANGFTYLADTVSLWIHFFLFPMAIFFLFPKELDPKISQFITKTILIGIRLVVSYGICLFSYKFFTGKFLEIPFLTVNFHDLSSLDTNKCIDRGGFFKLISTYNNGNLYGICMLMIFPFYQKLEKQKFFLFFAYLSLVLTFSRTVWIGLVFVETLIFLSSSNSKTWKHSLKFLLIASFGAFVFLGVAYYFHLPLKFFLDSSFGNRLNQFNILNRFSLFGVEPFSGIFEITYLGVYKSFGLLGLVTFCLAMLGPITLVPSKYKSIKLGLITYSFISLSDGALLLIPVMTFYWFLIWLSFSLSKSPHGHLVPMTCAP